MKSRQLVWPGFDTTLYYKEISVDRSVYLKNMRTVLANRGWSTYKGKGPSRLFCEDVISTDLFKIIMGLTLWS